MGTTRDTIFSYVPPFFLYNLPLRSLQLFGCNGGWGKRQRAIGAGFSWPPEASLRLRATTGTETRQEQDKDKISDRKRRRQQDRDEQTGSAAEKGELVQGKQDTFESEFELEKADKLFSQRRPGFITRLFVAISLLSERNRPVGCESMLEIQAQDYDDPLCDELPRSFRESHQHEKLGQTSILHLRGGFADDRCEV
eukprot:760819-Hanusia_phi.AAC.5